MPKSNTFQPNEPVLGTNYPNEPWFPCFHTGNLNNLGQNICYEEPNKEEFFEWDHCISLKNFLKENNMESF